MKNIIGMFVVFGALSSPAIACRVTVNSTGTVYTSVQIAFNASAMTDTLTVNGLTGPCYENVLFTNDHLRIILTGINNATISGNSASPVIDTRTKGSAIIGIRIIGGSDGIAVRRNANAIIDNVTIQGASGNGIAIYEMAYSVIMGSVIDSSGVNGILVSRGSSANIGFNNYFDANAKPNNITNNGQHGVYVVSNSVAYISSNSISGNRGNGIGIAEISSAKISNNSINSNYFDGVGVDSGSYAKLGESYPAVTFFDYPNYTTAQNGRYGISCISNSTVEGHLGAGNQLSGANRQFGGGIINGSDANIFSPNCGRAANTLMTP